MLKVITNTRTNEFSKAIYDKRVWMAECIIIMSKYEICRNKIMSSDGDTNLLWLSGTSVL